ncbi:MULTISPECIES: DMT family transporter [Paracoccus]|jgi:drug/metabolite transporter (DMT)-like permease|nr:MULTISPECIES: DMT family transporter [Paracoccus]MBB4625411.1 drug/metabolite transporter (DMT)-like permease [Paracoccus denitrificans]MCU7428237.1 DMT family transporter [Paracoccus denitrificans]MDK8875380.1 DMT family transporter [Paracoccus sp. SSJ]UFS64252.1 DMT family transporter [Paracoccus denitrificans]UPV95867.1 DMT family transporter [Paracoccus denitrificans]
MAAFICNDALMKAVTQTLPLYESIAIRGALVLLVMLLVAQAQGGVRLRVPRGDVWPLALRTVADVVSTVLYLLALRRMALADISAIMQALPLAVTLAAALFFRERLGWRRLLAIGIGFLGVLLILRPGTGAFDMWSAIALAAMLLIVLRDLATRTFSAGVGSSAIAFYAALAVMLTGFVLGTGESWRVPTVAELSLLALAALFLTVGYITAVATMRVGEIAVVAPFRYTSLVWAVVLGLAIFGEWPDLWTWAGSALVVGAGIYTILRERQLQRRG